MRQLVLLLFILLFFSGYAQEKEIHFSTYAEKYYFTDALWRNLHNISRQQGADSIRTLESRAATDKELLYELELLKFRLKYTYWEVHDEPIGDSLDKLAATVADENLAHVEADVLQYAGDYYFNPAHQQAAGIEHFIAAYSIYKNFKGEDFPAKQEYTYVLGGAFYKLEDYDNAIKYLEEAWHTKRSATSDIFCSLSNTIGLAYRNMKKYDSAIYYFSQTYRKAKEEGSDAYQGIAVGNIGITYFLEQRYDEAIPLLKKDIETSIATTQIQNGARSMAILATIYNHKRRYDEAEALLRKALNLAESRRFWPQYYLAEELYTQMYIVYAAKKDFQRAYLYADSALMAKDSVEAMNKSLILAKAHDKLEYSNHKLEAEKLHNQIKLDQLEISKTRIETIFSIMGVLFLLMVIVFIARERKRSETLLLNILPEKIAERLKKKEHPIADYFDNASILFVDMAEFTKFSDGKDPKEIVNLLNNIFTRIDAMADKHGLEKIKTIGDCYMAVSGLPEPNPHHAEAAAKMALEIKAEMKGYKAKDGTPIFFRIGLDSGPVVAGVIGRRKFIYDLWGDTVNTASRMETTGLAGEIHCSDRFKKKLEYHHEFQSRGEIEIKGKGIMETWLLLS